MAKFFIIQEIMDNPDGFHGSFYLHKDLGENAKWTAGPIWDLVCYFRAKTDYTFRLKAHYSFVPHWIGEIIQYESFCQAVDKAWSEVYPNRMQELYQHVNNTVLPLAQSWAADADRWGTAPTETAELLASRLNNALKGNVEWFAGHLPKSKYSSIAQPQANGVESAPIYYNLQGIKLTGVPTIPGIYIECRGTDARKVMVE